MRTVTATGDILTVTATEHSNLFLGLRGVGFNFGIVLSATWRKTIMNPDLVFSTVRDNLSNLKALKIFHDKLPAPLPLFTFIDDKTTYVGVSLSLLIICTFVWRFSSLISFSMLSTLVRLGKSPREVINSFDLVFHSHCPQKTYPFFPPFSNPFLRSMSASAHVEIYRKGKRKIVRKIREVKKKDVSTPSLPWSPDVLVLIKGNG